MALVLKRDDSFGIPPLAIVILCLIGSSVILVICYGAWKMSHNEVSHSIRSLSAEQHDYMATVRARNLDVLESEARKDFYGHRQKAAIA